VTSIDVFVPLLDEGVDVWRPASAAPLGGDLFLILPVAIPETERWSYPPGQVVRCSDHAFADGVRGLAAVEAIPELPDSLETWIELHDSVLGSAEGRTDETVFVLAPAYIHRWEWRAGRRVGTGWKQPAWLRLRATAGDRTTACAWGSLDDGRIETREAIYSNMVPVPLHAAGLVHLWLNMSNGRTFEATGSGIDVG
jgi:hypothetical protein